MPLATQPGLKFYVVLDIDKQLPANKQPKFFYRHPSGRKQLERFETMKNVDSKNEVLFMKLVFQGIREMLCGWENMTDPDTGETLPFNAWTADDRLEDILTLSEANELFNKMSDPLPAPEQGGPKGLFYRIIRFLGRL